MYASVLTRGDIAHSVCMLSKYMHAPTEWHMSQARRTLAWLASTPDYGPTYCMASRLCLAAGVMLIFVAIWIHDGRVLAGYSS
jgi:hypothetical protein